MAKIQKKRLKKKDHSEQLVYFLVDEFLDHKRSDGRSEKTLKSYKASLDKFFNYVGKDITIEDFDINLIYKYKNHLNKERENEALSKDSVNHYLRDLRTFTNWLYDNDYMAQKVKIELVKGQDKPIDTYTDEEIDRLIQKPDKNNNSYSEWRTWAIVCFILGTGQRIGTVVNVTMGDIHFGRKEIVIREQKNKKANIIPLDKALAKNLKIFIDNWRSDATDNEYLFCNIEGEKLTVNALQNALRKYNLKRGVENTSAHKLRHTYARLYIMAGGDQFRLQKILGHSSLEMTRHYVNLFSADLKQDYDDLSPLANASKRNATWSSKKIQRNV